MKKYIIVCIFLQVQAMQKIFVDSKTKYDSTGPFEIVLKVKSGPCPKEYIDLVTDLDATYADLRVMLTKVKKQSFEHFIFIASSGSVIIHEDQGSLIESFPLIRFYKKNYNKTD